MISLKETYLDIYNRIDFQKIKDHPNILIAASFWEEERYLAARTCYKFMRAVDDLIDDHKSAGHKITDNDRQQFIDYVESWLKMIFRGDSPEPFQKELTATIKKFRIPSWPLEAFARSMIYDIYNDGFATLQSFIDYAGGASVAPAAIFVHLAGVRREGDHYSEPLFDVRSAALSCAIFSYLVHIVRDFQKDQLNNLNYFADDMIARHGLTREKLAAIAGGEKIPDGFRDMIAEYMALADEYRIRTRNCIVNIWPFLEPRYRLSLEIIFDLYLMVYERIDVRRSGFTAEEFNPSPAEVAERVLGVIHNSATLTDKPLL
ncbi:MAG TPA: squalene/phytoene synthase family protein [Bacteroidales bacterium]|nr:squalene/phytoene synthase family protein [Bacteroidales bacterium]